MPLRRPPVAFLIVDVTQLRVSIDAAKCQGHGRCAIIAPDMFDVDDLGMGMVLADPCPEKFRPAVQEAEMSCPEAAITLAPDQAGSR